MAVVSMALKDYIAEQMKRRGWSQRRAAEKFGLSHGALGKITRGQTLQPDVETLGKIAQGFEIPLSRLLSESGHQVGGGVDANAIQAKIAQLPDRFQRILLDIPLSRLEEFLEFADRWRQSDE